MSKTCAKVSVIMPVYNVENYVERSIKSVINQTYKNIELVIINDGSTDNSLEICKKYAKIDDRIKLITQPNAGLSAACNTGMNNATGEYLCSVDSDDYIEINMIEKMVEAIERTQSDVCICDFYFQFDSRTDVANNYDKEVVIDKQKAMIYLLENKYIQSYRWNKLFKTAQVKDIVFPVGKSYEDIYKMHEMFSRAEKFVIIPDVMYHYVQRNGSIIHGGGGNKLHALEAYIHQIGFMKENYPDLIHYVYRNCISQSISIIAENHKNVECNRTINQFIREYFKEMVKCKQLSVSFKIKALACLFCKTILHHIYSK